MYNKRQSINIQKMQIKRDKRPKLALQRKYRNHQMYHYMNIINSIIQDKSTKDTIAYVDLQCWIDEDQFMKREYGADEWRGKMETFREYYFYHEQCPRIFSKNIELMYGKWHDRKRDFIYRKVIKGYRKDCGEDSDSSMNCNPPPSHFLLNISEYNPFSKKYYLRVEARKQQALKQQKKEQDHTQSELENLNHQLSDMLNQMHDLSAISTFLPNKKSKIQQRKSNQPTNSTSQEFSTQQYDNSSVRFNFQKKNQKMQLSMERKKSLEKLPAKKKISIHHHGTNGSQEKLVKVESCKPSPSKPLLSHGIQSLKTKSIYSVSSFGSLKAKTTTRPENKQRQILKLNFDNRNQEKLLIEKKGSYDYEKFKTEKNSKEKNSNPAKIRSHDKVASLSKASQLSRRKIQTKPDEFCDHRLLKNQLKPTKKVQTHTSQHAYASNSKKNLFQIKNARQEFMNKIGSKKQKILQIKNH